MKTDIFLNRKSEADKHVLEIDPVTAPVVRHIFDLRLQGYSFRKIALQLNAEKVPAPRSFYYMAEGRENLRGETPFWNDMTVKTILRNEVYIGHMVQNKTARCPTRITNRSVNRRANGLKWRTPTSR